MATILIIIARSSYTTSKNSRPKNTFICTFCTPPTTHLHSGSIVTVQGTAHGSELVVAAAGGTSLTTVVPATAPAVSGEQKTLVLVANFSNATVGCSAMNVRDTLFTDPSTYSIDELYQPTFKESG